MPNKYGIDFHVGGRRIEISCRWGGLVVSHIINDIRLIEDTPTATRFIIDENELIIDRTEKCGDSGGEDLEDLAACTFKMSSGTEIKFITNKHEMCIAKLRLLVPNT